MGSAEEDDQEFRLLIQGPSVSVSFKDVCYAVPDVEESILKHVSGSVPAGKFLAILGPSGAGKTSLLDVLAGRNKEGVVTGHILIDGQPRPDNFAQHSGYVMQDDAFLETLTVRETLYYAIQLLVPDLTRKQQDQKIDYILDLLHLTKVQDTRIGSPLDRGISGGERRRLSIGVEMVKSPSVIYMDEPTSGLDSQNALHVMRAIHKLCANGHTVICCIHQPRSNIYKLFDYLLLLHEGKTIYFGKADEAVQFMKEGGNVCPPFINPADFFLDLLDEHEVEDPTGTIIRESKYLQPHELADAYADSDQAKQIHQRIDLQLKSHIQNSYPVLESPPQVGWLTSYGTLVSRTWLATIRDSNVMWVRSGAALAIGLLVGGIFFQQPAGPTSSGARINTLLFLMCVFSLFCLPAISRFIKDRLMFNRERASGNYGTSSYFLAAFTVEFPILLVIVLAYGCVSYWMVGLNPDPPNFIFFLAIIFSVIQVGFSVSQVISALISSVTMAIAVYMIVLVYSLLLGGFIVSRDQMPHWLQWVMYTSYFWYGFSGLCVNEFANRTFNGTDYGEPVLVDMGMNQVNKYESLGILLGIWGFLQILAFLIMHFFNKEKR